jgi:hypothetical protein
MSCINDLMHAFLVAALACSPNSLVCIFICYLPVAYFFLPILCPFNFHSSRLSYQLANENHGSMPLLLMVSIITR